ncbi:hypothetical protein H8356DRAFT_1420578 [Neocallimastix lanati (nom. inval.)]|nr:hypothetical protein H8356DRAFT_1420578 [Neocallimastix sp. JGI-2020a]
MVDWITIIYYYIIIQSTTWCEALQYYYLVANSMVEDYWSTIDQGFSGKIKGMIDGTLTYDGLSLLFSTSLNLTKRRIKIICSKDIFTISVIHHKNSSLSEITIKFGLKTQNFKKNNNNNSKNIDLQFSPLNVSDSLWIFCYTVSTHSLYASLYEDEGLLFSDLLNHHRGRNNCNNLLTDQSSYRNTYNNENCPYINSGDSRRNFMCINPKKKKNRKYKKYFLSGVRI